MESASSIAIGRTSARILILAVLQRVSIKHPILVMGPTYTSLTWSSVMLRPSWVTRVLTAFQPVNRDAKWTYTYANAAVVAPGTYGGTNTNNSRVTYTASMP